MLDLTAKCSDNLFKFPCYICSSHSRAVSRFTLTNNTVGIETMSFIEYSMLFSIDAFHGNVNFSFTVTFVLSVLYFLGSKYRKGVVFYMDNYLALIL